VLDIGPGAGAAALQVARRVGPAGTVTGADLSQPLVELANLRAERAGVTNAHFRYADMASDTLDEQPFDAATSQFGVMFFAEPAVGFRNVRRHLGDGGRLCFACWREEPAANAWSLTRPLSGLLPAAPQAAATRSRAGPFSLADPDHVRAVLATAGFDDIEIVAHDAIAEVPEAAVVDDDELVMMGIAEDRLDEAWSRVLRWLAPYRTAAGQYRLPLACWVVRARA